MESSPLAVYHLLSPSAAVRVSPICFGAMNLGENWAQMLGKVDKESAFTLLDHFYQQGGNFIGIYNNSYFLVIICNPMHTISFHLYK